MDNHFEMQWRKDPKLKYVDLCIYIDEHIPDMAVPGAHPDIENTVYNYLWLLTKALAIKKRMFTSFQDYDGYAFYSASRLFKALRNNYNNQGKVIKGKTIKPIKSCLNYTKTLLYPMKLEYQKETFNTILSETYTSKQFDALLYSNSLKAQAQSCQNDLTSYYIESVIKTAPSLIDEILAKSPFRKGTADYKKLRMSILLNGVYDLRVKQKLDYDPITIFLWKLPKSMGGYVKILLKEFYTKLKEEIIECITENQFSDAILDKLIAPQRDEKADYYD